MYFSKEDKTQIEIRDSRTRFSVRALVGVFLSKEDKLKPSAPYDVIISSQRDKEPEGYKKVKKEPFLVNSPGEYEIGGLLIHSFSENNGLIHVLQLDQQKVVYINELENDELKSKQVERIGEVDVLIVALGGDNMTPQKANNLISSLEPKMVIPFNYKKKELKSFLKSLGVEEPQKEESNFTLKKKNLKKEGVTVKIIE